MAGVTRYITFDCYDTLVAYSAGKAAAIREIVLEKGGSAADAEQAVDEFGRTEREMHESADFQPLGVVLCSCLEKALEARGFEAGEADFKRILHAVCNSRVFDDVPAVLRRLRKHFKTAILSNSETQIISRNIANIGVEFDQVVLAEQARCYKPDLRMFHALLERCECNADEIVHVAQGFYHDIKPAHALGICRIWINRNSKQGDPAFGPYEELPDLTGLPRLLGIAPTENEVREYVSSYSGDASKICFTWNGKHGDEFEDANDDFRQDILERVAADPDAVPLALVTDLYKALTERSAEAWSIDSRTSDLAMSMLKRGKGKAARDFIVGAMRGFDAHCAMQLAGCPRDAIEDCLAVTAIELEDESELTFWRGAKEYFEVLLKHSR